MAGWQPEIGLTINADGIERSAGALIPVAAEPSVIWTTLSIEESMTDKSSLLHFEILNAGNTVVQERVIIEAPDGWTAEVEDSDIVNLAIGESQGLRVRIVPDAPGEALITLTFEDSNMHGSSHSAILDVANDPSLGTEGRSGATMTVVFLLIFIVVGLVVAGMLIVRLRGNQAPPTLAPPPPTAFSGTPSPLQPQKATAAVVCWGCNKTISGTRRACSGCGARYHESGYACSASALVMCRNCQADVGTFVEEVSS